FPQGNALNGFALAVVVIVSILVAVYGHQTIAVFEKYGAFVFVAFCAVLGLTLLPKINWSLQPSLQGADHLAAWVLGTSVIFALVASWFSFASDYSRYLPRQLSDRGVARWIGAGTAAAVFVGRAVLAWLVGLAAAVPFVDSTLWQSPLAVNLLHNTDISGYVGAVTGAAVYLVVGRR